VPVLQPVSRPCAACRGQESARRLAARGKRRGRRGGSRARPAAAGDSGWRR